MCVCLDQVIEANLSGEMNLKIETDLVSVTTHFKDLGNPLWGKNTVGEFKCSADFGSHRLTSFINITATCFIL